MHLQVKSFISIITVLLVSITAYGQQNVYDETSILLKDDIKFGLHLLPKSWGLSFQRGYSKTVDRTYFWGIEALSMKHPKEQKQFNQYLEDAKSFVYGKLNSMYVIRPSVGVKRLLTDKLRKNGVEISLNSHIGPSLAFTKPIYLEIWEQVDGSIGPQISIDVEKYDPDIHSINNIYGRASSFKGFDELKFHPGVFFKTGLYFEYSPYQRGLRALEVGAMADVYFNRIPIMALERNKEIFFNFYANIYFGNKFNRRTKQ